MSKHLLGWEKSPKNITSQNTQQIQIFINQACRRPSQRAPRPEKASQDLRSQIGPFGPWDFLRQVRW